MALKWSQNWQKIAAMDLLYFLYAQEQNSVASKAFVLLHFFLPNMQFFEGLNWPGKPKCVIACGKKMFQKSAKIRFYFVNEGPDQEIERKVIALAFFQSNFLSLESPDKVKE